MGEITITSDDVLNNANFSCSLNIPDTEKEGE